MENKKNIPIKSFIWGFVACLLFTQFVSVKVDITVTDNYSKVVDLIELAKGGVEIDEQPLEFVSVTPDAFAVLEGGE